MTHSKDLKRFYELLDNLKSIVGGYRYLSHCDAKTGWPDKGVYFFFEPGEHRQESSDLRVVRVGTHAVSCGSKSTLWSRLRMHRGNASERGNHRGSVFRLLIGSALMNRENYPSSTTSNWGKGNSAPREIRDNENAIEIEVSRYIGTMPLLWIKIDDESGPDSLRKYIEKNSIGLLSNINGCPDLASVSWLGRFSHKNNVQLSGLWNSDHVHEKYNPEFLDVFEELVEAMKEC